MHKELDGKSIIVTGAGSGVGRQTALLGAQHGANVVVADISDAAGKETVSLIQSLGGVARFKQTDVSVEEEVSSLVDFVVESFGRLDGAHNNAGIAMKYKPIHELTLRDWESVLKINLTGVFLCMKYEIAAMLKTGGGAIVNTASGAGLRAQANAAEYVASKHGVVGLTKAGAIDAGPHSIRVNAVCPGLIMTPATAELVSDPAAAPFVAKLLERHSLGRFGKPEEIAEAVVWLLSDRSSFVNGLPMTVDAGYCAH